MFARLRHVTEGIQGLALVEQGTEVVERQVGRGMEMLSDKLGGTARVQAVVLLAAVLGLASADTGAISAVAPQLEVDLRIGNLDIGLLVTVSALTAAFGMLPVGWVTDRWNRTRMITIAIVLWAVAEIMSAVAPSFSFLLIVRLALGVLTAVTGPTLGSLVGDLFPARERSQIYGYILTGELLGAGFGLLVAGLFSSWFSWRVAFAVLAVPSIVLAWQFRRRLPEPARGGQSRLERGAQEMVAADDVATEGDAATPSPLDDGGGAVTAGGAPPGGTGAGDPADTGGDGPPRPGASDVLRAVRDPRGGVVLDRDPMDLGWWASFRYVVAVPSNVTLIVGSALGYFFFTGVETFALIYIEGHYGVGQGVATLIALVVGAAAVVGAVVGGRSTDSLQRRGHVGARLVVPAAAFVLAGIAFVPAIVSTSLLVSLPLFVVAGFFIAAPNPGLDAARLDIMPSRMWGRAEAVRAVLRSLLQAFAPLVFGLVSTAFGGSSHGLSTSGIASSGPHSSSGASGLEPTFLLMLVALVAAAVIVWKGRRPYPVDVAAAAETERRFPPAGPGAAPVPRSPA